ncbi:MAG: methyltransferase RsmF C-terminal domain-like protein [Nanoarchaeota archaeon]
MAKLKFMNTKEKKNLFQILEDQFGFIKIEKLDYEFLINEKNKIYILNKEIRKVDFENLKMSSMGLYIGELYQNEIRLSIEGSQLIGPFAKKNIIEITPEEEIKWIKGEELTSTLDTKNYVIIKSENDYFGCGKIKENRLMNYVPKTRRLSTVVKLED